MDELASNLLNTLKKPTASLDAKLTLFNTLKSHIKHQRVPESAQPNTIECVRLAISSQASPSLVTTGLSALGHLIKRLTIQEQLGTLISQRSGIIPVLLDKLGDAKENLRAAASQAFCDAWAGRPMEVEKAIKEAAILGGNSRAKEAGMQWVTKMHNEQGLQFRGFVPAIVQCLEDNDGQIREAAKLNLVDLFSSASDRAKADLKREILAQNVRKSIVTYLLTQLHISAPATLDIGPSSYPNHPIHRPETPHQDRGMTAGSAPEHTVPPSAEATVIEPLYIDSQRELEDNFRDMHSCFEGKETEANWIARDKNVLKLRRFNKGNAPTDFNAAFVGGVRSLLDGILKVANSLRTTMSSNGCNLVQELAQALGPALDPIVEICLQSFIKMCSATKNIAAQNGNATVEVLFSHASYSVRLSQHVWMTCQDKNVQPRLFASNWLKILLKRQMNNKAHFEHVGGLEVTEKCIKKGLADANPKVREGMRGTYWTFAETWPDRAELISSTLDPKSKQLLDRDPANPNAASLATKFTSSVGSSATNPRTIKSMKSNMSLKEAIAAQKKTSLAAKMTLERPSSAMANLSPMRQERTTNNRAPSSLSNSTTSNSHPTSNQSSLMAAPVRRPRRPDVTKPVTADANANHKIPRAETPPSSSPMGTPGRLSSKVASSKTASSHVKSKSTTSAQHPSNGSLASSTKTSIAGSPKSSPASRVRPKTIHGLESIASSSKSASSSSKDGNLTMVVPGSKSTQTLPFNRARSRQENERPGTGDSSVPSVADEDNLTLVMPERTNGANNKTPGAIRLVQAHRLEEPIVLADEEIDPTPFSQQQESGDDVVSVYVDPSPDEFDDVVMEEIEKPVLEELPLNGQNVVNGKEPSMPIELGRISPTKRSIPNTPSGVAPDRTDILKARRTIASAVDRLRTKTLDAHAFRRIQELVKSNSQIQDLNYHDLVVALIEYLESSEESLRVDTNKAQNLKSQALAVLRAVLILQKRDGSIRKEYARSLCTMIQAKRSCDPAHSHLSTDLDRSAEELVKHAGEQGVACVEAVMTLVERADASGDTAGDRRRTTSALGTLAKLLSLLEKRQEQVDGGQRQRMTALAVRFLDDMDAEVRRADTEFCVELHALYGSDEQGQFWDGLAGARETQKSLVAYYLARRGRRGAE